MTNPKFDYLSLLFFASLAYCAVLLAPLNAMPIFPLLDPSWGYALNYFIHTNLKFGPDFVFTYGPLGFLSGPNNVSNNIAVANVVRFAVWALLLGQLAALWLERNRMAAWLFVLSLGLGHFIYHAFWEQMVLAVILVLYVRVWNSNRNRLNFVWIATLTGILFLLKFSSFVLAAFAFSIYTFHWLFEGDRKCKEFDRTEAIFVGLIWMSGPIAYLIYNPSVGGLAQYVQGQFQVASGYMVAMSLENDPGMERAATIVCSILALTLAAALWDRAVGFAGAALLVVFTWACFRQGFSRSDPQHSGVFLFLAPLLMALLIALIPPTRKRRIGGAVAFALILVAALPSANFGWRLRFADVWKPNLSLFQGRSLFQWNEVMQYLNNICARSLAATPIEHYRARLDGKRVMMFPWDLALAAQSKFDLFPEYTLQNYQIVTHFLDMKSAEKLSRANPPVQYVVFEFSAIDGRHPVTEAPLMWSTLFREYDLVEVFSDTALLERRQAPLPIEYAPLSKADYRRGVWVDVPRKTTPVAVGIHLRTSPEGWVRAALYKIPAVEMEMKTAGGVVRQFRIPPDVVSSPFVINMIPFSFEDVVGSWQGKPVQDPVVSIRLIGDGTCYYKPSVWEFFDVRGMSQRVSGVIDPLDSRLRNQRSGSM